MNASLRFLRVLIILAFSWLSLSSYVLSQWSSDPNINTPICSESHAQYESVIADDGIDGAIIAWVDNRNGTDDIYAQRVNASGIVQWMVDGVALCTALGDQLYPSIIGDGSGGAIVAWCELYGSPTVWNIYAQRVNSSGIVQWGSNGIPISIASGSQFKPSLISDGGGGVIIAWDDYRKGNSYYNIFAQRIDTSGIVKWESNGVEISTGIWNQAYPQMVSDRAGGAIIAWNADSGGLYSDIYAQRINPLGVKQWGSDGIPICTAADAQMYPSSISDGAGGSIITWMDFRNAKLDIYAQRVNHSGIIQWDTNGVAVSAVAGNKRNPMIATDCSEGAIITWQDDGGGIYVQHIDASGNPQWHSNGTYIATAACTQWPSAIVTDSAGGAILAWNTGQSDASDIYAQYVSRTGLIQWNSNGIPISTAAGGQCGPLMVSDGKTGVIITWQDYGRNHIYAQQIDGDGNLGGITDVLETGSQPLVFRLSQNYPNPFNPTTTISYRLPSKCNVNLKIYDILGREVVTLVNRFEFAGENSIQWDAKMFSSGVYFYRLVAGSFTVTKKLILLR
jgi:hypothetical protein